MLFFSANVIPRIDVIITTGSVIEKNEKLFNFFQFRKLEKAFSRSIDN